MPGLAQSTLCTRSSRFEGAVRKNLKTQVRDYRTILAFTTRHIGAARIPTDRWSPAEATRRAA